MSARRLKSLVLAALALGALLLASGTAAAHPLGNFTISRFSGIEVTPGNVTIHYVVDMAEIPTFQELPEIDLDEDGRVSSGELDAYAQRVAPGLLEGVSLAAGGEPIELSVEDPSAALRPGQGGLDVLRLEADFSGTLPAAEVRISYDDGNFEGRIGWKEVVAYARAGQGIASSSVPAHSSSDELRSYPKDLLSSPLDVSSATIQLSPGAGSGLARGDDLGDRIGSPGELGGSFAKLIEGEVSPGFLVVAVLLAMAFGALHALGPGHGKTVMAAYLVGAEGRTRHEITIGIAVSVMHTASVVVLGMITLWASNLFAPEAVYPWLSLASGVVVLALGTWLLVSRLRARAASLALSRADETHEARPHAHDHQREPGPSHTHAHGLGAHSHAPPAGVSPLSRKGLAAVALSGGLLPSPTALVVLLGAVALRRVALGVVLVAAFSVGLAAALAAVGILVLQARSFASRRLGASAGELLPILSAAAIVAVGLFLTARALPNV